MFIANLEKLGLLNIFYGRKAKVQEQALMDVRSVLDIANLYNDEILEEACRLVLKDL